MKTEAKHRKKKAFTIIGIIVGAIFVLTLLGSPDVAYAKGKKGKHRNTVTLECGDTVGPGKRVILGNDLDCSDYRGGEAILTVVGPVTFDMNNHTITGNSRLDGRFTYYESDGIVVKGENARIRRGTVTACYNGVVLEGEGNHRLIKVHAVNNDEDGFVVESEKNRMVFTRSIENGDNGYEINGDHTMVVKSRAQDNEDEGFYIGSNENKIYMCRSIGSGFENIELDGDKNRLYHSSAVHGQDRGIDVEGNENRVYKNKSRNNDEHGISVDGSTNKIVKNRVYDNAWSGIIVEANKSSEPANIDNVVRRNVAKRNGKANPAAYWDLEDEAGLNKASGEFSSGTKWKRNRYDTKNVDEIE